MTMLRKVVFPDVEFTLETAQGAIRTLNAVEELSWLLLRVPPEGHQGLTIVVVRERLKLVDKLEAAGEFVLLDVAEHVVMLAVLANAIWTVGSSDQDVLTSAVENAEEVEVEEVPASEASEAPADEAPSQ